jgi:ankyrin repeat protein
MKRGREEEELHEKDIERFHKACVRGYMAKVKDFIERGIDVNARDENEWTPIHCVAMDGCVEIANVLIQNGADVNALDGQERTSLHLAASYGHVDVAKVLIQNGADVNAVNTFYETPLHRAASYGHVDVLKTLIQNSADVNAVEEDNETALFHAVDEGHVGCILQLLCFGAAIDRKALREDKTDLLGPINNIINLLRAGKRPETSLMSNEEKRFMWELAFSLTIQHRAAAFKAYYTIRSFITFHGIFMTDGYDLGELSIWKKNYWW